MHGESECRDHKGTKGLLQQAALDKLEQGLMEQQRRLEVENKVSECRL